MESAISLSRTAAARSDESSHLPKRQKEREREREKVTFTGFPVIAKVQPDRTETKRPAHRAETLVGTTRLGTLAGVVFAAVTVHSQTRSGQTLAAAIVAGPQIDARVLAGPVAVSQQALVDICTVMERDVNFEGKLTL